ncbi:extensin [Mesorhizobium sp. NBSH29]|uniref:extensin-like domain-containing protein n=1 Tax=Mesorhizobium sp. NBSH29 TaxID=2654249 RepID=UPI0018965FF9|nr:extensin family protein [Mesorhizobium sp. NBSH29]QPC88391.1 extensin [Mesorhizobium sp. NBSH29]
MPQKPNQTSKTAPARPAFAALSALTLVLVSSCTTDSVLSMRPDVDVGTTSALAMAPVRPAPAYAVPMSDPDAGYVTPRVDGPDLDPEMSAFPQQQEPQQEEPRVAVLPGSGMQRLVPSNPYMAGYPRMETPRAEQAPAMPADEVACRRDLKRLGVTFKDLAPIRDGSSCRIDNPVSVSGLSGGIVMKPAATLNCQMAATFARWTKNELAPASRKRYFSGIKTIHQGSSYSCRRINGTSTPSEHSLGNALDIMRIELKNGRDIDVKKPGWFSFRERGFLNTVRADGCDYFSTVLGPGYNYDHRNHFHFDIKPRRNGYRACK